MKLRASTLLWLFVAVLFAHALILACILSFPAAPIRANAARIVREPAPETASAESPRPERKPGATIADNGGTKYRTPAATAREGVTNFRSLNQAGLTQGQALHFAASCAAISNPATASSRIFTGPGSSSVFYPVKQNGVPNLAPTLPAVAGLISKPDAA